MVYALILMTFYILISISFGYLFKKITMLDTYIYISKSEMLLLPFVGISFIISVLQNGGVFGGSKYGSLLLLLIFIGLIVSLKSNDFEYFKSYSEHTFLIALCFLSTFITLLPSIVVGFPTSFASINNDLLFYLSIPEWLKENSYFKPIITDSSHPFFSIANLHFSRYSRVGADYLNTLSMNWFDLDAIKTFNTLSGFFCLLVIVSVYYTSKYCFKFTNFLTLSITSLATINSVVFWMLTTQYMPQIAGNAFFFISIGLFYKTITERNYKFIFFTSLCIAALIAIYSEYLIYLVLPAISFLVLIIIRDRKNIRDYLLISFYILVGSILANPTAFYLAVRYNLLTFKSTQNLVGIVDYIPFINQPLIILGLKFLNEYGNQPVLLKLLSILIFCILVYGLLKIESEVKKIIIPLVIFICMMLFYLKFINKFPYGYYKTLMFSQMILVMLFCNGLINISKIFIKNVKRNNLLIILILLSVSFCNLYNILKLENVIINKGMLVNIDYLKLNEMKNFVPSEEQILVYGFNIDDQHVISYFLKDRKISFNNPSYYFPEYIKPDVKAEYALVGKSKTSLGDIMKLSGNIIWNNKTFTLYKNINGAISLNEGWNGLENWGGIATRWTTADARFTIDSNVKEAKIEFKAFLPPGVSKKTLNIFCNNKLVDELVISSDQPRYTTSNINLDITNGNKLNFVLKEGSVKVGTDTRELGIAIQDMAITQK